MVTSILPTHARKTTTAAYSIENLYNGTQRHNFDAHVTAQVRRVPRCRSDGRSHI